MLLALIILFVIYAYLINTYPAVTTWDRELILSIQETLKNIPLWVPTSFDCFFYSSMIVLPLLCAFIFFFLRKKYFDVAFLGAVPLITYGFSSILKHIVERPRPPIEYHLSVHPGGFSFVSSHTLISFCLWSMVIYYLVNYCENKLLRNIGISIAAIWIIAIGFSRAWLGIHNPSDVLAAYFLGIILVMIYIKIRRFFEKYIGL